MYKVVWAEHHKLGQNGSLYFLVMLFIHMLINDQVYESSLRKLENSLRRIKLNYYRDVDNTLAVDLSLNYPCVPHSPMPDTLPRKALLDP